MNEELKMIGNPRVAITNAGASAKKLNQLLDQQYELQNRKQKTQSQRQIDPPDCEPGCSKFTVNHYENYSTESVSSEECDAHSQDDQHDTHKKHLDLHDHIMQLQLSKTLINNMMDEKIRSIKKTESDFILKEQKKFEKDLGAGDEGVPRTTENDNFSREDVDFKKIQSLKGERFRRIEEELMELKKLDILSESCYKFLD